MTKNEFNAAVNADIWAIVKREENLLEEAAMQYGSAVAMYESARLQRLHESIYIQLRENIANAMDNMKEAAVQHYNNCYDGATE